MDASFSKLRMVPRGVKGNNEISFESDRLSKGTRKAWFIHTRADNLTIVQELERAINPDKSDGQLQRRLGFTLSSFLGWPLIKFHELLVGILLQL